MLEPEPGGQQPTRRGRLAVEAEIVGGDLIAEPMQFAIQCGLAQRPVDHEAEGMVVRTLALAERPDDVALLAAVFSRRASAKAVLAADAIDWLTRRAWPGNVRELRAMIEAAVALAGPGGEPVDAALLRFVAGEADESPAPARGGGPTLPQAIERVERRMLSDALSASGGNQSEAARALGLSRVGLIKKLSRLGLR